MSLRGLCAACETAQCTCICNWRADGHFKPLSRAQLACLALYVKIFYFIPVAKLPPKCQ